MNTGVSLSPSSRYPPSHANEEEERLAQEAPVTGILSAYQRETIFRGTNLESPVPTLELRMPGFETPLPSGMQPPVGKQEGSQPVSPADSDPFSDYLSYESDQVATQESRDEHVDFYTAGRDMPKELDNGTPQVYRQQQQPQPRIITDLREWQSQQASRIQIPLRSPLDELCHNIQAPSDLPTSPSPVSPKPHQNIPNFAPPPHDSHIGKVPTAAYPRAEYACEGWEPSGIPIINRPQSSVAAMPNYSLPSFKPPPNKGFQKKTSTKTTKLGVWEQWMDRYRRASPILSCMLATILAVGLTVCGRGAKTGITRIAKIPSAAFVDLGNGVTHVEMFPSGVCLVDSSNR